MNRIKVLGLTAFIAYGIFFGILYNLTRPLFHLKTFATSPETQASFNNLFWVIIIGGSAVCAAGAVRLVNEVLRGKWKK